MSDPYSLLITLSVMAFITGFFSGLLGIGGGIILAPLLLILPPLMNLSPLSIKDIAGITILQGLFSCLIGLFIHKKYKTVSFSLIKKIGFPVFIFALMGGVLTGFIEEKILTIILGLLALIATWLIFLPQSKKEEEYPDLETLKINTGRSFLTGASIGFLGGLVGQGGSFILIPLMTSFVKVPTRVAIGSNLGIALLATLAGTIGKGFTNHIPWKMALPVLVFILPATYLGSILSHKLSVSWLRFILGIIIGLSAIKILWSVT